MAPAPTIGLRMTNHAASCRTALGLASLCLLLGYSTLPGQQRPKAGRNKATVEGDVYLVVASGDVKKGAGRQVYLVPASDSLSMQLKAYCDWMQVHSSMRKNNEIPGKAAEGRYGSALAHANLEARLEGVRQSLADSVRGLIAQRRTKESGTGMNGHYRFTEVVPGAYFLWSEMILGDNTYAWWSSLDVARGATITRDLDNSSEVSKTLYCGPPFRGF